MKTAPPVTLAKWSFVFTIMQTKKEPLVNLEYCHSFHNECLPTSENHIYMYCIKENWNCNSPTVLEGASQFETTLSSCKKNKIKVSQFKSDAYQMSMQAFINKNSSSKKNNGYLASYLSSIQLSIC